MNKYLKMNENDEEDINNECIICFNIVDISNTHLKCCNCENKFHKNCMDKWKKRKNIIKIQCPCCTKNDLLVHNYDLIYNLCCLKIKKKLKKEKIYEYN